MGSEMCIRDSSEAEYRALLEEADRIRAYQSTNGVSSESTYSYSVPSTTTYTAPTTTFSETSTTHTAPTTTFAAPAPTYTTAPTTQVNSSSGYAVEIFEPTQAPQVSQSTRIHRVVKGDTLYNISKRYDVAIASIKAENGITGTNLSLGQQLSIPGVYASSINNSVVQPIFASAPVRDGVVTRRVIEQAPQRQQPVIASGTQIYAVLPKDTLYSISRRSCVGVQDLIIVNGITDPNNLQPGQRLTLPSGHCLAK